MTRARARKPDLRDPAVPYAERIDPNQLLDRYPWPAEYPPLDLEGNARWRLRHRDITTRSPSKRDLYRDMCRRDALFWMAAYCWVLEPRSDIAEDGKIPFVPYNFQLWGVRALERSIDLHRDLLLAKSRDMGATWLCLFTIQHRWMFRYITALLASRKQQLVDLRGDTDSLFEKLRVNLRRQPTWLLPAGFNWDRHDNNAILKNPHTGAEVTGASTTGEVGRGGRRTVMMLDEHAAIKTGQQEEIEASSRDAAGARWYVSTPRGAQNVFARRWRSEHTDKLPLHWSLHPVKGEGAFCEIEVRDDRVLPGKIRSPWYDAETTSRDQPAWMIAQELDISFEGSGETILDTGVLQIWRNADKQPLRSLFKDHRRDGEAALLIFKEPEPGVRYGVGHDPAGGTAGGSAVASQVYRLDTLEQCAEYQGRIGYDLQPSLLYFLGHMYNWADMFIEANLGQSVILALMHGHIDRTGIMGTRGGPLPPYPRHMIANHTQPDGTETERYGISTSAQTKHFMAWQLLEPTVRNQDMRVYGSRTLIELSGFADKDGQIQNPDGDDLVMASNMVLYGKRFMKRRLTAHIPIG